MGARYTWADIGGAAMKFVLYGRYDSAICVTAYKASGIWGCDFGYLELDCDPVLIAFRDGREIARTYDVAGAYGWVEHLVSGADGHAEVEL